MLVTFCFPLLVQFLSNPWFVRQNPCLLIQYLFSVFHHWLFLFVVIERTRAVSDWGGGVPQVAKQLQICARNYSGAQFIAPILGSVPGTSWWSCRIMESQYPQIICEYDPATTIAIRPLIQPHTCEMGSSIFAAMSWLKFAITTKASFTGMPSTERKNGENVSVSCGSAYLDYLSFVSPNNP